MEQGGHGCKGSRLLGLGVLINAEETSVAGADVISLTHVTKEDSWHHWDPRQEEDLALMNASSGWTLA